MDQHRFRAFLKSRTWGDQERHFTAQAEDDCNLPDPATWRELEAYLKSVPTISDKALAAARYVWRLYAAGFLKKSP